MSAAAAGLVGRHLEHARLASMVAAARSGASGVLVVTGPAGIGKTTLLQAALRDPPGFATLVVEGAEPEAELAYSALHRLLAPFVPPEKPLPAPQQQALDTVFGVRTGDAPDPFLVGLAALTVLTDVARRRPLVCVVDDVQCVDHASLLVLAFVARRLLADPIVLVFAARPDTDALPYLAGLPDLALGGLDDEAQLALLDRHAPAIRPEVARRIVRESAGNPLALVEYVRSLSPRELSGEVPLAQAEPLPAQVDHLFDRDIRALPEGARLVLTIAALEPSGDAGLIRRSAEAVGVDSSDDPERHLGRLASVEPRVRFEHPLVRSAAYRLASPGERRRIHAALADAGRNGDPIRRAWHLARAADGPDAAVADELDAAAAVARTRGGHGAESELLHRAAELTDDDERRDDRLLRSATAAVLAGRLARALTVVQEPSRNRDRVGAAKVALVRAKALLGLARIGDALQDFGSAASTLQGIDDVAARDAWLHALYTAFAADGGDESGRFDGIARAAVSAGLAPGPDRTFIDLVAVGLVQLRTGDRAGGIAVLREAFAGAPVTQLHAALGIEASFANVAAMEAFDLLGARRVLERLQERDQRAGALPSLARIASSLGFTAAVAGHLRDAHQLMAASMEFHLAWSGDARWGGAVLHALALSGREEEFDAAYDGVVPFARGAGVGSVVAANDCARGELLVARGRYVDAVDVLRNTFAADTVGFGTILLATLVEAAARGDDLQLAQRALDRLEARAIPAATPWADGLLARSRALLAAPDDAEAAYVEALARLAEAQMPLDLARARLLYGEWLRRRQRRTDAVEQLGAAHEALTAMGAEAFADRARSELGAAGGRPRRRSPETRDELTAQERHVAAGAAAGATNREIASAMFISEATVAYHLRKVFQKLGVSSRRQLRDLELP